MPTSYKTPGVYVQEIVKFPPSVAEVETAIPAFIGYTRKAKRFIDNDLHDMPLRIKSLLEFEQYYGQGPSYRSIKVSLTPDNIVDELKTDVVNSGYNLYESMRMFYDNGGGACYVCSVGVYEAPISNADIIRGLEVIRKFDEPTLLVFPDAVSIKNAGVADWDKIAAVQTAALKQCGELGDRFAILDVPEQDNLNANEQADKFRTKIGMNNLKYGAAYTPFLKTVYDKTFKLKDIDQNLFDSTNTKILAGLKTFVTDSDLDANGNSIKAKLDKFKALYADNDMIPKRFARFLSDAAVAPSFDVTALDAKYQALITDFRTAADDAGRRSALKAAFGYLHNSFLQLEGLITDHPGKVDAAADTPSVAAKPIRTRPVTYQGLQDSINALLLTLQPVLQKLRNLDEEAYRVGAASAVSNTAGDKPAMEFGLFTTPAWLPAAAANENAITPLADITIKGTALFSEFYKMFQSLKTAMTAVVSGAEANETALEQALIPDLPIYSSILKVLNNKATTLPPSGAVAGVYAAVDRDRGVWKAPANVTLNSVASLSEVIDDADQERLNVDVDAGKSINAIRSFYGKGIMVWGARTLAGNDNEWRYVSVRRFFNFMEESCKKSTAWSVFEPNDANTWVRVKAQIENFLNNLWRRGALNGAKPEHAYVVNCGLGITMTADDILNGYLVVEIAVATVRPAEFVVLKFSHKLQQS